MKQLAAILCVGIVGFAHAQSTSTDVEIYERYEDGELVEQRQSATKNGVPIDNFDFEKAKRDMMVKPDQLEQKMEQMQARFEQKRLEMERSMDERMNVMEQRMTDFEKRSEAMHQKMEQRMMEMEQMREEHLEKSPKVEKPVVSEHNENVKFT